MLLPASMLCGAAFMPAVDVIARISTAGEIPVGIITALLGAPFFLYLLRRSRHVA
jgi:iron complex transport system permease protein